VTEQNIRILLEYDGTPFLGWQVQPQGPTVQSVLEETIGRVTGERVHVKGSGRTDAGVHALGQVANFRSASRLGPGDFLGALNALLPPEISVLAADAVSEEFDSQFSAAGKTYRYRVFNRAAPSPLERMRAWHINRELDIESVLACIPLLIGKKDFSSFMASGSSVESPVRDLRRCEVQVSGPEIAIEVEADGFLRHMVRNIAGTLVDVGRGRFSTADFARIVAARDRTQAGRAAPPWGLYLVGVDYPSPYGPLVGMAPRRRRGDGRP